ncbi:mitochondrial carrier protein [Oryctes borbonicus]|uniref:Mitochondrial basic amino acids transporter n=1 Tax=Oryctes borbonicus TaxID=1629725 RepID=A0A0T6B8L9_9SCAR|nr:mitochondrial carrier protein [Oryctes borbonicus]
MALDFFAGCLGGCAGVIVGHPLDTIKVNLQTQNPKYPQYTGTYHCFKSLLKKDGVRGLYRGISSPLASVAGINAIIFGVYGNTQRFQNDPNALASCAIAGAAAGLSQSFLNGPMELIKIRMQVSNDNRSPLRIAREIYYNEGIRGVFRGLNITILRELPAFSSYFVTYECLTRTSSNSPVSTGTMLVAGGLAGVVSWIISYPVDIIKTRLQIDGVDGPRVYKNSLDCLKKSVAAEGYGFLVRGLTPAVVRAFPVNAACFTVVTWTLRLFDEAPSVVESSEVSMWDTFVYNMQTTESTALVF